MIKKIVLTIFVFSFVFVCFYAYSEYGSSEEIIEKSEISKEAKEKIEVKALKLETISIEKKALKSSGRENSATSINFHSNTVVKNGVIDAVFENAFSVASMK